MWTMRMRETLGRAAAAGPAILVGVALAAGAGTAVSAGAAGAVRAPRAVVAAGAAGVAGSRVADTDAARHAGEQATVCGLVAGTKYAERTRGKPTFLDFEKPHPAEVFRVVIWGEDRAKFSPPPEAAWDGRQVCVTGLVKLYRGVPEVVVRSPAQLALDDRAHPPHG